MKLFHPLLFISSYYIAIAILDKLWQLNSLGKISQIIGSLT